MKKIVALVSALALVVAAWAGVSYRSGVAVERALKSWVASSSGAPSGAASRLTDLMHTRGLFASSGQFHVVLSNGHHSAPFLVAYSVDHRVLPAHAGRFSWLLQPAVPLAVDLTGLIGADLKVTGEGTISHAGGVRSDIRIPSFGLRRPGGNMTISESSGMLSLDRGHLSAQLKVDKIAMRGRGGVLEVQVSAAGFEFDFQARSGAQARIAVDRIDLGSGAVEGLELTARSARNADRFDTSITQSARKVEVAGQSFTDLRTRWELNGLHADSVETLVRMAQDSGKSGSLKGMDSRAVAEAAVRILGKGFAIEVPVVSASSGRGILQGAFAVTLVPAEGSDGSLIGRVRFAARASVQGALLSPSQLEAATGSGFAEVRADMLTTSAEYAGGVLKVNGHLLDAALVEGALTRMDAEVQAALGRLGNLP